MEERLLKLEREIQAIRGEIARKKLQQIDYPIDDISLRTIEDRLTALTWRNAGTTLKTQDINLTGNAQTITVPAAYTGTEVVLINGTQREIPYIA